MRRTSVGLLVALAVGGGAFSYLAELLVQVTGGITIVPPVSLAVTLTVIATVIILMAIPVRRRVTGKRRAPLDPFYSVRVAVLAKASTLTGAILSGVGVGILIVLFGRPVLPDWSLLGPTIALTISSVVLVVAGAVAEWMCVLPPDNRDDEGKAPAGEPAA